MSEKMLSLIILDISLGIQKYNIEIRDWAELKKDIFFKGTKFQLFFIFSLGTGTGKGTVPVLQEQRRWSTVPVSAEISALQLIATWLVCIK